MEKSLEILTVQPMFVSWTQTAIAKLSYFFKEAEYVPKQAVYREGDVADAVYICTAGEFRLYKKLKRGGLPTDLVIITPGEIFGEIEVEKNCPRTTSCIAMVNSSVLYIPRTEFYRRINNYLTWNYFHEAVKMRDLLINTRISQI